jgi:hypothetical protein
MPTAPFPNKTKIIDRTILNTELMIIIIGNDLVSREAMRTERNKLATADIPIRRINITVRSNPIAGDIHCLKTSMPALQTNMLEQIISKDALTRTFASSVRLSEKLFPKKRVLPVGTAKSTIVEKIVLREIIVEATPITSGVVNLDRKSHKRYPATTPIMLSI